MPMKDGWYWVKILEESDAMVPLQMKFGMWYDSRGLRWNLCPITVGPRIPDPRHIPTPKRKAT